MWTPATRREHNRDELRHATDPTKAEWEDIDPISAHRGDNREKAHAAARDRRRDLLRSAVRLSLVEESDRSAAMGETDDDKGKTGHRSGAEDGCLALVNTISPRIAFRNLCH